MATRAWLYQAKSEPETTVTCLRTAELRYRYRLHDTTGDDLGTVEHPAPNVEPGDVAVLADGREAIVTARVETYGRGPLAALLEVAVAPTGDEPDG